MLTRSPRIGFLLAVLALLAGAVVARAEGFAGEPWHVAVPAEVRAGDCVELTWIAPDGVLELELELSLDDGATWSRASPELPGAARAWTWRVPDAPSPSARLRLRVGTEHGEYDLEAGEPFRIRRDRDELESPWDWPRVEGSAPLPRSLGRPGSRLEEARLQPHVDAPARLSVSAPRSRELQADERTTPRTVQPSAPSLTQAPRFVPLRN